MAHFDILIHTSISNFSSMFCIQDWIDNNNEFKTMKFQKSENSRNLLVLYLSFSLPFLGVSKKWPSLFPVPILRSLGLVESSFSFNFIVFRFQEDNLGFDLFNFGLVSKFWIQNRKWIMNDRLLKVRHFCFLLKNDKHAFFKIFVLEIYPKNYWSILILIYSWHCLPAKGWELVGASS